VVAVDLELDLDRAVVRLGLELQSDAALHDPVLIWAGPPLANAAVAGVTSPSVSSPAIAIRTILPMIQPSRVVLD
jgi:hypothetical protein